MIDKNTNTERKPVKKIINGTLYNTETASLLGKWKSNNCWGGGCQESLHRTKSGKFFIHVIIDTFTKDEEGITPLSPEGARNWAEEHLSVGEYGVIFGVPEEASDNSELLILSVAPEVKEKLEAMSKQSIKSITQIVSELVNSTTFESSDSEL